MARWPSLWAPLERSGGRPDLLLVWEDDAYLPLSFDDWRGRAWRFAAGLRDRGVTRGDRLAVVLTNSADACAAVLGAWLAGACLLSLPLPARGMDPARYVAMLRRICADAEPALLTAGADVGSALAGADLGVPVATFASVDSARSVEPDLPGGDDAAFVQYSSGSTSDPKGCVLTPDAIARQLASLDEALEIDSEADTGVVWLPLAHDMGLFGCLLLTYWTGHRLALGTPQRFLTQPWTWFDDCAELGATVSATPSFGLDFATRVARRRLPPPFPMRRLVLGGERIEPAALERAVDVLGDERLPRASLLPAYGLAEAVLAVTTTPVGEGPTFATVDGEALERGELVEDPAAQSARPVRLTAVGRPLPGCEVRTEPATGLGELHVRSPSLTRGYLGPAGSAGRLRDGELATGDLGFELGGRWFVAGRHDDLIPMAGRNVYARDLELALGEVPGVRAGNCAVVGVADGATTELVALVETKGRSDAEQLRRELSEAARRAAGVAIDRCVLVPHGRLPKTPSGKVQRFRCRQLAAGLEPG